MISSPRSRGASIGADQNHVDGHSTLQEFSKYPINHQELTHLQ